MGINLLGAGVGVAALGGLVYGAILYASAEDKAQQIEQAKGVITNVVIGLILFGSMAALLQFIIPGGVFGREYKIPKADANPGKSHIVSTKDSTKGSSDSGDGGDGGSGDGGSSSSESISSISVKNSRDAGALTGALKTGTLYRTAALTSLSDSDKKTLSSLLSPNGTIIDLRILNAAKDDSISGAENVRIPIGGVLDLKPMVSDATHASQTVKALKTAANADGPVFIHCAAGKDRTGWLVAMIMTIAGANDQQVMDEYLKSNDANHVEKAWLNSGLSEARSKYGGVLPYLKHFGLTASDINKLRTKFKA